MLFLQLDLPFSRSFYRWLLNEELHVGLADLSCVAPEVQTTLVRLQDLVLQRDAILAQTDLDVMEKTEKVRSRERKSKLLLLLYLYTKKRDVFFFRLKHWTWTVVP